MRKRRMGFTLVELLVVMAIIAILASIALPNAVQFIRSARANRALGEVGGIETALTKILADSNRGELGHLFVPGAVPSLVNQSGPMTAAQFQTAQSIYSAVFYVLLTQGRGALSAAPDDINGVTVNYRTVLNPDVVGRLGTSYIDELGTDPWGNLYQIWPGPWPSRNGPVPFRTYAKITDAAGGNLPGQGGTSSGADALTVQVLDPETELLDLVGYPAPKNQIAFIWSFGQNLTSGQAVYQPNGAYPSTGPDDPTRLTYYPVQDEVTLAGGGDDINNWDSTRSWERFYN